jgi:hypothetical protein
LLFLKPAAGAKPNQCFIGTGFVGFARLFFGFTAVSDGFVWFRQNDFETVSEGGETMTQQVVLNVNSHRAIQTMVSASASPALDETAFIDVRNALDVHDFGKGNLS